MSTTQEKRNSILKDLKNLLIWISIALIIRWQVIEPRWIPSGSMLPTLQIQDKILVEKITPKITSKSKLSKLKNQIVVFNVPEQLINAGYEADTALIKRFKSCKLLRKFLHSIDDVIIYINALGFFP